MPGATVLRRIAQWGPDMSQVSGKLNGHNFEPSRAWAAPRISGVTRAARVPAASGLDGARYRRRLQVTDLLAVAAACALPAAATAQGTTALGLGAQSHAALTEIVIAAAWAISLYVFDTHAIGRIAVGMQEYKYLVLATTALAGAIGILALLTSSLQLRGYLVLSLPLGLAGLLLGRFGWRQWLVRQRELGFALSNVLVYGQAGDLPYAVRQISRRTGPAYRVVGVLLDGEQNPDAARELNAVDPTLPLARDGEALTEAILRLGADSVVIAGPLTGGNQALREVGWELEQSGTRLIVVSALSNIASRRVRTSPVDGMPLLHVQRATFSGWRHVLKRGFDVIFAALALLALAPVFLVIAVLIRLDGPGRIFFLQERAGRDGTPFRMFKFRTMVQDAEARLAELRGHNEGAGPLFKLKDDPRVTRSGRWLRRHSLDELPQFLNVLLGHMSVVGPRPPLFKEVADYRGHTHRRLYLKPGVTGLWQVSGRSNLDWQESVRLDLYYVENWTILSDLRIIWRTVKVMITPDGAF